ncbi:MAG: hypothetical protein WC683_02040 [bacterium]
MTRDELLSKLTELCGEPEWTRFPDEPGKHRSFATADFAAASEDLPLIAEMISSAAPIHAAIMWSMAGATVCLYTDASDAPLDAAVCS